MQDNRKGTIENHEKTQKHEFWVESGVAMFDGDDEKMILKTGFRKGWSDETVADLINEKRPYRHVASASIPFLYARIGLISKEKADIAFRTYKEQIRRRKEKIQREKKKLRYAVEDTRKVRTEILARDQNRCRVCGANENLEIQHIIPFRISKSHERDSLLTLCHLCHDVADHKLWVSPDYAKPDVDKRRALLSKYARLIQELGFSAELLLRNNPSGRSEWMELLVTPPSGGNHIAVQKIGRRPR